jgi:hypothetical protein
MNVTEILTNLRELTRDFVNGKRNRQETVIELYKRIDPEEVYDMANSVAEKAFITEVFISLNSLIEEGFAPSLAEMKYFDECFEGKRVFSQEEVRSFPIGDYENQNPPPARPAKGEPRTK